jgi:tetratricopeptide (TPR) repeat protein
VIAAASMLLLVAACSGEPKSLARVAVLPANVLIPDASANWMAGGIPLVFLQDLATSKQYAPVMAADDSAALLADARYTLRTSIEARKNQFFLSVTITDITNQRSVLSRELSSPLQQGLLPVLNQLAKEVDKDSSQFGTGKEQAFILYSQAMEAPMQQRTALLERAIAADPDFGTAYLALMDAFGQGNEAGVRQTAAQAQLHLSQFRPLDQARAKAVLLKLRQAPAAEQQQSLQQLADMAPGDVNALASLATLSAAQMRYADADAWLDKALALEPANLELRRQRARVQFSEERFADAEKTFEALGPSNAPILDIAACRLMQGDMAGANALFTRYAATNQPFVPLARANWLMITGHRTDAISFAKNNPSPVPQLQSLALSQLAVWTSAAGDASAAEASAQEALRLAGAGGVPHQVAQTAMLIALSGKDWNTFQHALGQLQPPAAQTYVLGYALFLRRRYAEAAQIWAKRVEALGDPGSRVMCGASFLHAGNNKEAAVVGAPLLIPNLSGGDLFVFVSFPEMLKAKAELAKHKGQTQVASRYERLVQSYAR